MLINNKASNDDDGEEIVTYDRESPSLSFIYLASVETKLENFRSSVRPG